MNNHHRRMYARHRQYIIIVITIGLTSVLDDVIIGFFANRNTQESRIIEKENSRSLAPRKEFPPDNDSLFPADNNSLRHDVEHLTNKYSQLQGSLERLAYDLSLMNDTVMDHINADEQSKNNGIGTPGSPIKATSKPNQKLKTTKIRMKDADKRGPPFNSIHDWAQFHHFLIYKKGVPVEPNAVNFKSGGKSYAYEGYDYLPPDISRWEKDKKLWKRSGRFPSVEKRIKYYMGRWYDCPRVGDIFGKEFKAKFNAMDDESRMTGKLLINPLGMNPLKIFKYYFSVDPKKDTREISTRRVYLRDIVNLAILHNRSKVPVIVHVGDEASIGNDFVNSSYPVFGKVRDLVAEETENHCRSHSHSCNGRHSTIIWPMNSGRHLKPASYVPQEEDTMWDRKINKLVWRGGSFGIKPNKSWNESAPSAEVNSWRQRYVLVANHTKSKYVDAKFVGENDLIPKSFFSPKKPRRKMTRFKYLLSVEGNDVSSGLKWMLMSNSVVFLPPIQYASWAMESLLEPYVHYVPVNANMSNLEEMVMWANTHQIEVRKIAERSTLFMYDLLFHPDAYKDEEAVMEGIVRRYKKCLGGSRTKK
eukprot:CAMPEP_0172508980 /NCGR_PEP_ID=MMETSP1066-20121228/216583_1 /TAXON_ID=671091 /ORGANISM="Coscinodiscus wailesii, Strain CCMP2513" /LENGTH=587 /DNA_ID=CAMNT_0013287245 /DNA_START=41 /DNA_END=1804 /DNA_ORIENTATION=+